LIVTMGSTVCVRCGATLLPHSYCEVCQDVLSFLCSSCSMFTDERIHDCDNSMIQHDNDVRKLVQLPNSSQIVLDDRYNYVQNHLNEEIKYNSINLFTSYWNSIFDSFKLVNRYWRRIIDIGSSSQNIS
jgi:hypothetical protein